MPYRKRLLSLVVLLFSVCVAALGQAPPSELEARFAAENNVVELRWHQPDGAPPSFYNVYRKPQGDSVFHVIGTPVDKQYDDGQIAAQTAYAYYVTAVYDGNLESVPTTTAEVITGPGPGGGEDSSVTIQFISSPTLFALLNGQYLYDADVATIPQDANICFSLEKGPAGMMIDGTTGVVSWTPSFLGVFEVEIKARLCGGAGEGEAEQEFRLMVTAAAPGSISGTVHDTAGEPVPGIKIKIFDVVAGIFILKSYSDSAGHYAFPVVNPGTYFMKADAGHGMLEDQWYNGVRRLENASPVAVGVAGAVTVNFTLRQGDEPGEDAHLSGVVRDTAGNPLPDARVTAFGQDDHTEAFDDLYDDDHDDHRRRHGEDRSGFTDSSGRYLLTLHAGSYMVSAVKRGFAPQFWDHHDSPLEANVIDLHHDTSDIDFDLRPFPEGNGSIAGHIRSALDSTGLESHVMGFRRDSAGHLSGVPVVAESDSTGAYLLDHLTDGNYILLAHDGHDFIPTFYSADGGTPLLAAATPVAVTGGSSVAGIDIFVRPDSSEGLNEISGEVTDDSHGDGHATPLSVTPLAGVIVTVLNGAATPVGSAITAPDGGYLIPGMGPGTYSVLFQHPGKASVTVASGVSYANNAPTTTVLSAHMQNSSGSEAVSVFGVQARWNLVSVPLTVSDYHASALFPGSISAAFAYTGSYSTADVLRNGIGYWLEFPSGSLMVTIVGTNRTRDTVDVEEGWNLIGSVGSPIPVSGIVSMPPGMVTSQFFGYQGRYLSSEVIAPGRGYWVKTSAAGKLIIAASADTQPGVIRIVPTDELPPGAPDGQTSVQNAVPKEYALGQNFPNPFNPTTTVAFDLPVDSRISVEVFNMLGQKVRVLVDNAVIGAGRYAQHFDATELPTGVYFYRLEATSVAGPAASFSQVKKMLLVK